MKWGYFFYILFFFTDCCAQETYKPLSAYDTTGLGESIELCKDDQNVLCLKREGEACAKRLLYDNSRLPEGQFEFLLELSSPASPDSTIFFEWASRALGVVRITDRLSEEHDLFAYLNSHRPGYAKKYAWISREPPEEQ